MRTVAEPIDGAFVRVEPANDPGIRVNGIPATLDCVQKADVRVDLQANRGSSLGSNQRAFVVEHVLGPLRLCGITAAEVVGIETSWDFARPEHRFCYSAGLGPDAVVGHPAGLPNPDLATAVQRTTVERTEAGVRRTVEEPVSYATNNGTITVAPREYDTGVELDVQYRDASLNVVVPPEGAAEDLIGSVTTATTPYLAPDAAEGATHAVADVLSDVVVLGGLDDVRIDAELGGDYHALTIGVARRAKQNGVRVEKERK